MSTVIPRAIDWTEQGLVPDMVIRQGIRRLVRQRLLDIGSDDCETGAARHSEFVDGMGHGPIAPVPELANEQHYEVPPAFFEQVLGAHRKYSCGYWPAGVDRLDEAEKASLELTCQRAGIGNGQTVLDLGCGWGSLSLWIASRYPETRVTAVSNSEAQRDYIESAARARSLENLQVLRADMNRFDIERSFDRVVSIEMFEHMRNWPELFGRISTWLKPDGKFFMHVFCHRSIPYAFEDTGPSDWMSRHFFSGGIMPSDDLALHFQDNLRLVQRWRWDGTHYERTANAWLEQMDCKRNSVWPILEQTYGVEAARQWWMRWRIFFMACAELFGYDRGQQWWVAHYLFANRRG